jgi:hypothetical protein
MARPKPTIPYKYIGFNAPMPLVRRIDDFQLRFDTTKTEVIKHALTLGLKQLEKAEPVGAEDTEPSMEPSV